MKKETLPPYIHRNNRGKLYFVKRHGGKPIWIRLETQFEAGAPIPFALHQERERLLNEPTPVQPGKDMSAVIRHYHAHKKYRDLEARTQQDYDKQITWLDGKIGHIQPRSIKRPRVIEWLNTWAKNSTPHNANYRFRVLRILLSHAVDMGLLEVDQNPAKGVSQLKYEKKDREPWPSEKVKKFRETYPQETFERLVFELCLGTGQRIGDVLEMRWSDIEGDGIRVKQNKTKKPLWLPFTDQLRATLAVTPKRGLTIVTAAKSTAPRSYRSTAHWMLKAREAVGARDYDLHSLRYSACAELCLAGCTDEEIASITGQSDAMVKHYTQSVRQKIRALKAQGERNKNRT